MPEQKSIRDIAETLAGDVTESLNSWRIINGKYVGDTVTDEQILEGVSALIKIIVNEGTYTSPLDHELFSGEDLDVLRQAPEKILFAARSILAEGD